MMSPAFFRRNFPRQKSFSARVFLVLSAVLLVAAVASGWGVETHAAGIGQEDGPATADRVWLDPDGNPLPFKTDEEVMEFMRIAKVVSVREIGRGITRPEIVLLEKDGVQMRAHFQSHDERKDLARLPSGRTELGFRDTYLFNIAAYELGLMLGLDNIPPSIKRKVRGKSGSLTPWLEKSMDDRHRQAEGIKVQSSLRWLREMWRMRLFDELIQNTDRNQGNIMYDENWKVWLIDHTRAFRRTEDLLKPERIKMFDRDLWEKIMALDEEATKKRMKGLLRESEVKAIFKRREKLAAMVERLLQERSDLQVFFTMN